MAERPLPLAAYEWVARLARPASRLLLARRMARGKEDPARIGERRGEPGAQRPGGRLVWIHGASVGEMLSAVPLAEALGKLYPGAAVVMTSGTVTSAAVMATRAPDNTIHQLAPLDIPAFIDRFLDYWRPDMALFVESELWPNMICALARRRVPSMLLNARMSERSAARWRRAPRTISWLLARFELVLAQTKEDAARLKGLGATGVKVAGNLKFDAPAPQADTDALAALRKAVGRRPVLAAASTHPGEEEMVAAAHQAIAADRPRLLTIIAPRHPERGQAIAAMLQGMGLNCARRGAGALPGKDTDIYIADTLGEMGLVYRLCHAAFMGGSLVAHGGQNPIEPAKLGAAILHGPHVFNFAEVYRSLDAAGGSREVADPDALAREAEALLADPAARKAMANKARQTIESAGGALAAILSALAPHMARASE